MKRWKSSVFVLLLIVFSLLVADLRMTVSMTSTKALASTGYVIEPEDTVSIYWANFSFTSDMDPKERERLKNVKNIRLMCNAMEYYTLYEFTNAETLYFSKDMVDLSYMQERKVNLPKLKEIIVDKNNPVYESYKGALFTKSLHCLLLYPQAGKKEALLPEQTQIIGEKAFWNTDITSVKIPDGLWAIGKQAFADTNFSQISLPASFRIIGEQAFLNTPLTNVKIAADNTSLVSIDGAVFSKDKTYLYYWPENKKVENLILPDQLIYLDCSIIPTFDQIKTITIPKSLESIGNTETNKIEKIILPKKNTNFQLYDGVLYSADQKKIRLYPNNNPDTDIVIDPLLEQFPMPLFYKPNTTKTLTLPKGLTALSGTKEWKKVLLGGFENLSELKFDGKNTNFILEDGVLYNKDRTSLLWYPANLNKKEFMIPDSVTVIENDQLVRQNYLEKLTIPAGCNIYDYSAFKAKNEEYYEMPVGKYCPKLKTVEVAKENKFYVEEKGVLFSKDRSRLLVYPSQKRDKTYQIPDGVIAAVFGNENAYLQKLTVPESVAYLGVDRVIDGCEYEEEGFLQYTALKEIKIESEYGSITTKDGVLYQGIGEFELLVYPVGKTDRNYNLPKGTATINNISYLENNPYLRNIYVDKKSECNSIRDGELWMVYSYESYGFDRIKIMER